jgi:hypothetical protein
MGIILMRSINTPRLHHSREKAVLAIVNLS